MACKVPRDHSPLRTVVSRFPKRNMAWLPLPCEMSTATVTLRFLPSFLTLRMNSAPSTKPNFGHIFPIIKKKIGHIRPMFSCVLNAVALG